jgi:GTP pyrophosphokinase
VRVLVNSINDCYAVLGWIHTLWKPIPGRIKDYIAMPKPNMYQSLHTTVIGPGGTPVEIQIRTYEMHRIAEYGIAAHWKYKEGKKGSDELGKNALALGIKELEQDVRDSDEFMDEVKKDLYTDEVFVFTPKGKVIELPKGACPIDFAYRIHSDVGNSCVGAKINNKMVPLTYKLKNGDIIEVLTNPNKGPSRDWLKVVVSAHARNKIKNYFRKADKEENIQKGKDLLEREIKHEKLNVHDIIKNEYADYVFKRFNVSGWDDLYSAIGYGGIKPVMLFRESKKILKKIFRNRKCFRLFLLKEHKQRECRTRTRA